MSESPVLWRKRHRSVFYDKLHLMLERIGGCVGIIAKQVNAILGKPHDVTPDSLQVALTIRTDKRRHGLKLGEEKIETLAEDLLNNQEDEDDFVIVTNSDQRIGPKEIYMKSTVVIKAQGKSVERKSAWKELEIFYNSLKMIGATEQ